MSNQRYAPGKEGSLDGTIILTSGDIRVILLKSGYAFSSAHKFVSDLTPASYDNGRSAALTTKTVTNGVFNADPTSITATAAVACSYLALYQYNASDALARLIAYIDTATGLPLTPAAGGTVPINWDTGANKIFAV